MSLFLSLAQTDPMVVKAVANVAASWRKNEHGYGFYGRGSLDYPGDRSIEITMNVRVRPRGFPESFPEFPEVLELSGSLSISGAELGWYAVKNGKAGLLVFFAPLQEQLEGNENEPIYFDTILIYKNLELRRGNVRIEMKASVSVRSSPPAPIGDIPEWDTQFFQGGLPSLGKRRP